MNDRDSKFPIASGEYFYEMLDSIKQRPGMYIGRCSLTRLRSFLDGYMGARADLGIPLTQQEKEFNQFPDWIQDRFKITSTQSWDSIILFHSADEREALDNFFKLFEEFRQSVKVNFDAGQSQEAVPMV
jgi:hypothetical protein